MIKRYWRGWTSRENADAYEELLQTTVFPRIASKEIPGYRGVELWRRPQGDEVAFVTVMEFDSIDNVRHFVGDDYERAYVPEQARRLLSRFDDRSVHFDVKAVVAN